MVRQLKHHESKLLKKVDFLNYKSSNNIREIEVIRRYHLQKREDYTKYNHLANNIKKLVHELSLLDSRDPFRHAKEKAILKKLFDMGIINNEGTLSSCEKISVSAICRYFKKTFLLVVNILIIIVF
jgi:U3 small nucleolar ribonucleoprotein protein IMP3